MANVLIMTDSVACLPTDIRDEFGIKVVPAANIIFDGQNYIENVTITATEAYQLIEKDPDKFLTSAMTPQVLMEEFEQAAAVSSEIVHITLSSSLSAGYKTAGLAAQLLKEKMPDATVHVVDSLAVAGQQGLVVRAAAMAAQKGMSADQILDTAQKVRARTGGLFMLATLRYIYRTGRMSRMGSRIASMFNIRPINKLLDDGTIVMVDRTRNRDHSLELLIEHIKNDAKNDSLHFMLNHANDIEVAQQFKQMLEKHFTCRSVTISDYSPVMGYGAGSGALFVGYTPSLDLSE